MFYMIICVLDLDYYHDPIEMTKTLEDKCSSPDLTPLSPTITGDELNNWKLNEVFQDIIDMENNEVRDSFELLLITKAVK